MKETPHSYHKSCSVQVLCNRSFDDSKALQSYLLPFLVRPPFYFLTRRPSHFLTLFFFQSLRPDRLEHLQFVPLFPQSCQVDGFFFQQFLVIRVLLQQPVNFIQPSPVSPHLILKILLGSFRLFLRPDIAVSGVISSVGGKDRM